MATHSGCALREPATGSHAGNGSYRHRFPRRLLLLFSDCPVPDGASVAPDSCNSGGHWNRGNHESADHYSRCRYVSVFRRRSLRFVARLPVVTVLTHTVKVLIYSHSFAPHIGGVET